MRQGLRVLRGAVYARTGAQQGERFSVEGSARACEPGLFGSATAGADGEFLRRSVVAANAVFGIVAGGSGRAGNAARPVHHVASARFWRGHRGGAGERAKVVQPRASSGAIWFDAGTARDGANLYARRISREDCDVTAGQRAHCYYYPYYPGVPRGDLGLLLGDAEV